LIPKTRCTWRKDGGREREREEEGGVRKKREKGREGERERGEEGENKRDTGREIYGVCEREREEE